MLEKYRWQNISGSSPQFCSQPGWPQEGQSTRDINLTPALPLHHFQSIVFKIEKEPPFFLLIWTSLKFTIAVTTTVAAPRQDVLPTGLIRWNQKLQKMKQVSHFQGILVVLTSMLFCMKARMYDIDQEQRQQPLWTQTWTSHDHDDVPNCSSKWPSRR